MKVFDEMIIDEKIVRTLIYEMLTNELQQMQLLKYVVICEFELMFLNENKNDEILDII
jgi:hypothetical protein